MHVMISFKFFKKKKKGLALYIFTVYYHGTAQQ